jgi:tripartite ATP-independent transporter DctM subunit
MGVSCASAIATVGFLGLLALSSWNAAITRFATITFDNINSYDYMVVPMFVFMACIMEATGIGKDLFDFFKCLVGRFPGGIAMATILACAVFAAISSAITATAVTIGLIAIPAMDEAKYDKRLSTGVVASGGTLGVLIPPSSCMIAYSIMSETSLSKCFMAGMIPGLLLALLMCAAVYIQCRINPAMGPRTKRYSLKEIWNSLKNCLAALVLIVFVLLGMFLSWFTPTEASGAGVAGAIIITLLTKRLTFAKLSNALRNTLKSVGMVFFVLTTALCMNNMVALSRIPTALANFVTVLGADYRIVTVLIVIVYLILGCFMDCMAMIYLTMPIFFPLISALGANPYWFAVIVTFGMMMGSITPPVGMSIYAVAALDKEAGLVTVVKGSWPYIVCMLAMIGLLICFPSLATWLPGAM